MLATVSAARTWSWRAVVFAAEAAYMLFELLAVRTMAPGFGTTLDVWTAIIGCVLLAGAVGNWIGGRLSDRPMLPVASLCLTSLLCASVPVLAVASIPVLALNQSTMAALATAFALFFFPCIGAGVLPPVAMTSVVGGTSHDGKAAGGIYAAATLGGLAGTFFGGFFLLPSFGTRFLTYCVALLYAVLAFACWLLRRDGGGVREAVWAAACVVCAACAAACVIVTATSAAGGSSRQVLDDVDTRYGHVIVYEDRGLRRMLVDGGFESAMYTEEGRESEPVFDYVVCMAGIADPMLSDGGDALLFGGAAYQLPKHLLDATKGDITVCEVDEGVTELARKWFMLDEVEARNPGRLDIHHVDGRVFVNGAAGSGYEIVVNDTFAGDTPARVLTTVEAAEAVKASLDEDGIYMVNVMGRLGLEDGLLRHELATLTSVFDDVVLLTPHKVAPGMESKRLNWVVVCGNDLSDLEVPEGSTVYEAPDLSGVRPFTDDWAPVEALAAEER